MFSNEQLRRYSRHLMLPEIGVDGQKKIAGSRVLCIGAGGLGSPACLYLAAAGIGNLGIIDSDTVELSNLQRQVLHSTGNAGRLKVTSAHERISGLNPDVRVTAYPVRLTSRNAFEILGSYDVIVDGTDNFPTRYLANDACVLLRKPYVYGAVYRFEGQASLLGPAVDGPCYRCLFPEPPPAGAAPSCAEAGVLGVLPGIVGLIQATEALKHILQVGKSLAGRLLLFDALAMTFREVRVKRDPHCPICGENPVISDLVDYDNFCKTNEPVESTLMHPDEITVQDLKQALADPSHAIQVLDVREADEYQIARIEGARLFPLSSLPQRFRELDPDQTYYLHCKAGGRSMKALEFLRAQGFKNLKSVKGGITAWSEQIDSSVPKY